MPIRKPSPRPKGTRERAPRPNNPFGLSDPQWRRLRLSLEHEGRWVAWSPGHESILSAGDSLEFVDAEVRRSGHDVEQVIFEWIEPAQLRVGPPVAG